MKDLSPNRDIDSPLRDIKDDALGRKTYAARVASIIAAWRGDHSAVIAIYGEWGSGKTSFKNFVLRYLAARAPDEPLVVEFNPWEWEGSKQLAEAFYAQIVEKLGSGSPKSVEVSERLSRYAAYFTVSASIAESASTLLSLFVPVIGPLSSLLAKGLKGAGEQAKTGADAKLKPPTLSDLRRELIESIKQLDRTLVVTIDDVDRLTTGETAMLFQLLKSNADFPNVVYLVLCDREVVAANLEKVVAGRGDDYLEKIVQLGLPLPKADHEQLRRSLLDGLLEIISKAGVEPLLDHDRLHNLYDQHAVTYFRTLRDVKRFLASFETVLPSVTQSGDSEVDLVDFIGSEILRTFEHDLYEHLYCYRDRVTGREGALSEDGELMAALQAGKPNDWAALGIFRELFPRFSGQKTSIRRARGISHPRSFDRYFAFAVPRDQYSGAEENDALARRSTLGAFRSTLEDARERGRLGYLIELLDGAAPLASYSDSVNYIADIGTFIDALHVSEGSEDGFAFRAQLERLILKCLSAFDIDTRTRLFLDACDASDGVLFAVAFSARFHKQDPPEITATGCETLREKALKRIVRAGDSLHRNPAVGEILLWWSENDGAESAKRCAETMLDDDDALLNLLHSFTHPRTSHVGKAKVLRGGKHSFAPELNALVSIETVLERVNRIDENLLEWDQRETVRAFRRDATRTLATNVEKSAGAP